MPSGRAGIFKMQFRVTIWLSPLMAIIDKQATSQLCVVKHAFIESVMIMMTSTSVT
jgi:hypothetical protein